MRICYLIVIVLVIVSAIGWITINTTYNIHQITESQAADDPALLEILRTFYIHYPSKHQGIALSPHSHILEGPHNSSWPWIHTRMREIYGDERDGFFVDAGALNGEFMSNTLWLERDLGWTGLLVEPDKTSYLALLSKHRNVWSSNTCLATSPKQIILVSIIPSKKLKFWNWVIRGASHEYENDKELSHQESSFSLVQCFHLASYLLALNKTTVDLLDLDLQGDEGEVFNSILTFPAINIRVILIQNQNRKIDVNAISDLGYILYDSDEDYIFIKVNDPILQRTQVKQRLNSISN